MKKHSFFYLVAWLLIVIGLVVSISYLVMLSSDWTIFGKTKIDIQATGAFGDYIGGFVGTLISISGFVFLYLTLKEQRITFQRERFESRFFEMVKFHRENVDKMTMEISQHEEYDRVIHSGQQCFKIIFTQLMEIRNDLRPFFIKRDANQIYSKEYFAELKAEKIISQRKISLKEISKIDISYFIVFYGVDHYGKYLLQRVLAKKYRPDFINDLLDYISLKPVTTSSYFEKWDKIQKISSFKKRLEVARRIFKLRNTVSKSEETNLPPNDARYFYRNDFIKYFGGHQIRLGHYYRHLFQTINLVDEQTFLSYKEKYNYIKTLRAQMSTFEQVIFYFNSISSLGDIWELRNGKNYSRILNKKDKFQEINRQLITKYNLIKNLSEGQLLRMNFTSHYPDVQYEFMERSNKRILLEKIYR